MRYESSDDVRLRLHRSVVRVGESPVYVDDVLDRHYVNVTHILSGDSERVRVSNLNLNPVPLGYVMESRGGLIIASRKPVRRYKQGLTQENLFVRNVGDDRPVQVSYTSRQLALTIAGQYPDIGEAFQMVRNGMRKACPFSREWAVAESDGELCILYRGETVGFVGDTFLKILPERAYLKESLEICLR